MQFSWWGRTPEICHWGPQLGPTTTSTIWRVLYNPSKLSVFIIENMFRQEFCETFQVEYDVPPLCWALPNTYILCSSHVYVVEIDSLHTLVNCTVCILHTYPVVIHLIYGTWVRKKVTYITDLYWRNAEWNARINSILDLREMARYWPFHCTSTTWLWNLAGSWKMTFPVTVSWIL